MHALLAVSINKPVDEVFAFFLDGRNNPIWRHAVLDIHPKSDGAPGVGSIYVQVLREPFGSRIDGDYEITRCEKDRLLAFQVIKGPARPTGTYQFESIGDETKVTFTLSFQPSGLSRLMEPMIAKQMEQEVACLAAAKSHLENRG